MTAMRALIAGMRPEEREQTLDGIRGGRRISEAAFMYADAMMKARGA